jgi:uncharacterized cupredoxin-like copper-binding protein
MPIQSRHPLTLIPAIALAGIALGAAGCGGDDNKSSDSGNGGGGTPAPQKQSSGGSTLAQSATEFKFSKPNPTVKAGKVTVNLTNDGSVPHAIEIEDVNGKDVESKTINAGESTKLTANLKPGKYEFYCPVDSHKQQGMKGTLTVK